MSSPNAGNAVRRRRRGGPSGPVRTRGSMRAFVDVDQPAAPPSDAREPRAWARDGRCLGDSSRPPAPSVEPPCRRARIEPARAADVFAEVVEHVDERVAHLARRPQETGVVSVSPDPAATSESAVHRLRYPDREAAHAALEARRLVRLHQQMQMVGLDAEMQNTKPCRAGRRQSVSRGDEEASVSEGGHAGGCPQRHVDGAAAVVSEAPAVWDGPTSRCGLAAGVAPSSTPGANGKLELSHGAHHLNWAHIYSRLASLSSQLGRGWCPNCDARTLPGRLQVEAVARRGAHCDECCATPRSTLDHVTSRFWVSVPTSLRRPAELRRVSADGDSLRTPCASKPVVDAVDARCGRAPNPRPSRRIVAREA